jgi:tetratricopeptide (TPR) repeat protein
VLGHFASAHLPIGLPSDLKVEALMKPLLKIVALLAFALSSPALAKPEDSATAQARKLYLSGLAHFNLQEYQPAIDDFEAAYRLKPDPVFLYNLGQSHRLADNPERALYFYRTYLRNYAGAPNRSEVEERITVLEKLIADKKNVATPPDHALAPEETPTPPPVAPTVVPPAQPAPSAETHSQPAATARTPVYKKWWLWTIVGVVAAGAAVGIAVGVTSQSGPTFNAGLGTVGPGALTVGF